MPEPRALDPERILAVLAAHRVDYVLVGGVAVQVHGHVRMTNDLDLIPAPTPRNLRQLAEALDELDARVLNPGSEGMRLDERTLHRATLWQLTTPAGDLDILHDAPGAAPYEQLRSRALEVELGSERIPVAGRDDLIAMKRAASRPVDLQDIAALTAPEHDAPAS
jgi:hypothetical protein